MKFGKSPPSVASSNPSGFLELAKAHVASHGGEWFVVAGPGQPGHQPHQWAAWMAYFRWLDDCDTRPPTRDIRVKNKFATFSRLKTITVPTAWPLEFDASAPPAPLPERPEPPVSPERRRELAAMLRQAVAHLGMPEEPRRIGFERPRSPGDAEAARRHFEARLPELAAEYSARPPVISPELVKSSPPLDGGY